MKKTRSANVELYRILLMFGIFLLHVVYHGGNRLPWVSNGLRWCVDGFVFISGWYGIDFRPSKVMRLVAVAVFASGIAIAVGICTGGGWDLSAAGFPKQAYQMMVGHWFLSAYLVLMLVSPLLNDMCSRFAKGDVFAAMCFGALLLWSWCRSLPILSTLLPSSPGLGEYTALSLAGVYAFARIVRLLGLDRRLSTGALIGVVVAMAPLCCLGYGGYSSFFAMLMAGATFLLLERWEMAWRWVFWVSPSMFALLLISQKAGFTYPYYNAWQRHFIDGMGWNAFAVCLGMAAVSFLLCLALDVPRRLSAWLARPLAVKCYGWMDGLFEKVCINISAWIERHSGGAR